MVYHVPSLLRLVNNRLLGPAEMLDVGGEGDPDGGVHMDVLLVRDVLLVHHVSVHAPLVKLPLEDVVESLLEVLGVAGEVGARVVAEQQQLPLVGLRGSVALEAVLVPALLLAHLAVPAQLLQALRLHLVGQPLGPTHVILRHPRAATV